MDLLARFFLLGDTPPSLLLASAHAPWLVVLSVLVAVATSYVALSLSDRAREAPSPGLRTAALAAGTLSLGGGVWTMHFIGMLAFQICGQVDYDPLLTIGSMLPSLGAAWVALRGLTNRRVSALRLLAGGLWMGSGIGLMHYGGMAAVRSSAQLRYDPAWFLASIVVAVALSTLALGLHHGLRLKFQTGPRLRTWLAAAILGGAISGMHYTAMGAARFMGTADTDTFAPLHLELALAVAFIALVVSVTSVGLNAALVQRQLRRDQQRRQAELEAVMTAIRRALVVIEFDLDGYILRANEAFLALTGHTDESLIGQHHRILCLASDADSPEAEARWAALCRGEFHTGDFVRVGRDGRQIWIHATYNPILDADGQVLRIVKFINDLTERHAMEQDLREAKYRAEQAAAAKSTFLANMSHEIRTPMNAIIGFSEVALEGTLQADARQHLQIISRSARSLLGLLNDILDTAKLDHGAVELEQRDFSLREVCADVMATLQIAADRKGLKFTLVVDEAVPAFHRGDPSRLQQVLLNLVGNAVKFTEQGAVTLAARVLDHGGLEVSVQDTGIGIAPDRIERIFDPFAQADASMTRRFGGTGLGTTIARQLVQLMGGEIGVHSTPGSGSRFWCRLPLAVGQAPVQRRGPAGQTGPMGRGRLPPLRILAADDVPENLQLLELKLGAQGHSLVLARDGQEALDQLKLGTGHFDLALLDVQMPRLDGLEACRLLRAHEAAQGLPRLPVIALTASASEADRSQTDQAGMDGFVVKPVDWALLHNEMARVLAIDLVPAEGAAAAPARPEAPALPETVDWPAAMARWGGQAPWRTHLTRFLASSLQDWPNTKPSTTPGTAPDSAPDSALAHRLRGTCATFGLTGLAAACEALERGQASGPPAWAAVQARLQGLQAALAEMAEMAEKADLADAADMATLGTAAETPADSPPWPQAAAHSLGQALARGELPSAAYQQVLAALPPAARERLRDAVDNFDFEQAQALLAAQSAQRPTPPPAKQAEAPA